jgi:lysophospholipase
MRSALENAGLFKSPVFLQLSDEDHIVDYRKSLQWFDGISSPDREMKIYSHYFHEIYNEVERELPIGDALCWLNNRCATQNRVVNQEKEYSQGAIA